MSRAQPFLLALAASISAFFGAHDAAAMAYAAAAAAPASMPPVVIGLAFAGLLSAAIVFAGAGALARRATTASPPALPPPRWHTDGPNLRHLRPVRRRRVTFAIGLAGYRRVIDARLDDLERHLACLPTNRPGAP